uniref:Smr domain-containing protein n=1 Tax=Mycena chlorophos TaxID=658473 RepID=A0ABQ0M3M9_MYCCL|nr:predicted protein [Mycena chlorophos]
MAMSNLLKRSIRPTNGRQAVGDGAAFTDNEPSVLAKCPPDRGSSDCVTGSPASIPIPRSHLPSPSSDISTPPLTPDNASPPAAFTSKRHNDALDFLMTVFPHNGLSVLPHSQSVAISAPNLGTAFEGVVLSLPGTSKTLYVDGKSAQSVSIRESIVALLDLADESLGCSALVIVLERSSPALGNILHSLISQPEDSTFQARPPQQEPPKPQEPLTPPKPHPKHKPRHEQKPVELVPSKEQHVEGPKPPKSPPTRPHGNLHANQANQHDSRYMAMRAEANKEGDAMAQCFSQSHEAYDRGDGALAKELSNKGKEHQANMNRINEQAANWIFIENNKDSQPGEVDLHGLYVREAIDRTDRAIEDAKRNGDRELRLIVGKGLHSQGHVAKLKPAIEELMQKWDRGRDISGARANTLILDIGWRRSWMSTTRVCWWSRLEGREEAGLVPRKLRADCRERTRAASSCSHLVTSLFPPAMIPLTLVFLSYSVLVNAGSANKGDNCSQSDNRLQAGTYQFFSDCNSVTYCAANGTCLLRGCRKDEFPFGYQTGASVPPKCDLGQFCPDEMDACQPLLAVGSPCQLNRDDECEAPPNFADLRDATNRGRNFNGSVCLNNVCMWANKTAGQSCTVENTPYIAYGLTGEFIDIVSRGDCVLGYYCDSVSKQCLQEKAFGVSCTADKECSSWNCLSSGSCGIDTTLPNHVGTWVYAVVAVGIVGGIFGTLFGLFVLHRRQRDTEREKRLQYWREQNAFHQNLLQMRQVSLPGNGANSVRSTMYSRDGLPSDEAPILQHAAPKGSGLRNYLADDSSEYDDGMMMQPTPTRRADPGRF